MRGYAQSLNKGSKKIDFKKIFPKNSPEVVETLDHLLLINPYFRSSATEAIKWKIFDKVRDKKNEGSAPSKIHLDIDRDEAFDYKKCVSKKYSLKDYKDIVKDMV